MVSLRQEDFIAGAGPLNHQATTGFLPTVHGFDEPLRLNPVRIQIVTHVIEAVRERQPDGPSIRDQDGTM